MEDDINLIRKRHAEEIKNFERSCKHGKLSDWMEEWWAPGHSTGIMVRVCKRCGKIVESKNGYADRKVTKIETGENNEQK
jgi:hypothetical protein